MKWLIKEYFSFSKWEMRVSILLTLMLSVAILINVFGVKFLSSSSDFLSDIEKAELDSIIKNIKLTQSKKINIQAVNRDAKQNDFEELDLFPVKFDPNIVELESLQQIGFPSKVIDNIIRYREAGGRFYRANDLRKIYGLNDDIYKQVEAFIQIESTTIIDSVFIEADTLDKDIYLDRIEINTASISELIYLKGVGEVIAGRIIKYRNLLGGYVSETQLLEVYGLNDTIILNNMARLIIDSTKIRKLSLNNSDFKEFLKHPYLELHDVKSVFELREYYKGKLNKLLLKESNVLNDSTFSKISPYLRN
jgi:competence protein ComEA